MSFKYLAVKYTIVLLTICVIYLIYIAFSDGDDLSLSALANDDKRIQCRCQENERSQPETTTADPESTCDESATARGRNQLVISYSLSRRNLANHLRDVEKNAISVLTSLPGWTIRIYHNLDTSLRNNSDVLCSIWCKYNWVDLCDVSHLPAPLLNQSNASILIWKFFVLGDPLVDRFLISELGSELNEVDVKYINTWIGSNSSWQLMRFHPSYHTLPFLLGILGGVNDNQSLTLNVRNRLINKDVITLRKGEEE